MFKELYNTKYLFAIAICLCWQAIQAQQIDVHKRCYTNGLYKPSELLNPDVYPTGLEKTTWSITDGYGSACTKNCNTAPYDNGPLSGCDGGVYTIPIAFTVVRECGTGNLPDGYSTAADLIADLDAQISQMNTYYDCQGLPIQLVKCTSHGLHTEADNSTRIITDATLCSFSGGTGPGTDNEYADGVDINGVLNVYIAEEVNGGTGCGGFAFLPMGTTSPDRAVMQASCFGSFASDPTDPCNDPGRAAVFIHEIGHILGLFHTHDPHEIGDPNSGSTAYALPSDPPCTTGDFIADTGADPNQYVYGIDTNSDFCKDQISGTTDDAAYNSSTVPYDNIMSYNSFMGCRTEFSECQKAKMIDALLYARSGLNCCDPAVTDTDDPAAYMSTSSENICLNGSVPTFVVNTPSGGTPAIDPNCIAWYDVISGGDRLDDGITFTPPTTGAGALTVGVPGNYNYYFDDDANFYTTAACDDHSRKPVTVTVLDDAGSSTPIDIDAESSSGPYTMDVVVPTMDGNSMLGWYFSDADPSTTLTTSAAISTAITTATTGVSDLDAFDLIFQSESGTPLTSLDDITIDCAALDAAGGDGTYFITPFVAYGDADINCSVNGGSSPTTWLTSPNQQGASAGPIGPVTCDAGGLTSFTYEIVIELTELSGTNSGSVLFDLNPSTSCGGLSFPNETLPCASAPCTLTYSQAEIDSELGAGFDPMVDAFCIQAIDAAFGGDMTTVIDFNVSVNVVYTGETAKQKWDASGDPLLKLPTGASAACAWGTPIEIVCSSVLPIELLSLDAHQKGEGIQVNWVTETETNNDYFILERSTDGFNFDQITMIDGAGLSDARNAYAYFDPSPFSGLNYYRLMQVDFDGTKHNVGLVSVDFIRNVDVKVFPNPTYSDEIYVNYFSLEDKPITLQIYNTVGALQIEKQLSVTKGDNNFEIPIGDLGANVYVLKIIQGQEERITRFIKYDK